MREHSSQGCYVPAAMRADGGFPHDPAAGVVRGVRAAALAALCVLLPLAGHLLSRGHAPRWGVVAVVGAVACWGAFTLTRRRLTDSQLLWALTGAQVAYHAAYSLPGMCAVASSGGDGPVPVWHGLVDLSTGSGPPPWVMLAGHAVTVVIAARLLGFTEALLWQSKTLLITVRQLLLLVWPFAPGDWAPPAARRRRHEPAPLHPALWERLNAERAPPGAGSGFPLPCGSLSGPMPIGGACLPLRG